MTLGDLEYLGLRALEVRDYGLMVEWMEEALSRTSADDTETRARLLFYIARGHYFVRTYQNIKCCEFLSYTENLESALFELCRHRLRTGLT